MNVQTDLLLTFFLNDPVQLDITGQGFGKYQNQADSDQGCVDVEVQLHFLYHRCVCF